MSPAFKIALISGLIFISAMAIFGPSKYIVSLSLALSIFFLSFLRPATGLFLFVASLPLFQFSVPGGLEISIPAAVGYCFFPGALFGVLFQKRTKLSYGPESPFILAFIGAAAISAYFNLSHNVPQSRALISYILLGIMYFLVLQITKSEKIILRMVITISIVTTLVCLFTIYQYITGQYKLFSPFTGYEEGRTYGVADPNYTAAFIATILPLMLCIFFYTNKNYIRVISIVQVFLAILAITTTASRGGMIATTIAVLASLVLFFPSKKSHTKNISFYLFSYARYRFVASTILIIFSVIIILTQLAPEIFWQRASSLIGKIQESKTSRTEIWLDYLDSWKNSPFIGLGPGYTSVYTRSGLQEPHNTLIDFLVQTGILGTSAILGAILLSLVSTLKRRREFISGSNFGMFWLSSAMAASLIAFFAGAFFLTASTHKELWLILGICGTVSKLSKTNHS